jgi:uncharacterized caspase-like protein
MRMEASMAKHLTAFVLAVLVLAGTFASAHAEKRVALVIGNSTYQHTVPLKNPSNDASDMAGKLRQLGFEVIDGTNLSKAEMEQRIRTFAAKLSGADVGLFFYAGHGLQVDGKNFLAPIDARLKSDADIDFEAVELNLVLKQLERNSRVSIVFLDACRDNPLASNLAQSRSLQVGRGLAQVEKAVGMMISFATQPGNVALDGEGRNSPFTNALLGHIDQEGTSINDVMVEVRKDVLAATAGKQVPWENSSLTGQFYFKPAAPKSVAEQSAETAAQIAALRQEIDRLQTSQGAALQAQQEQLEILKQKLNEETKKAVTLPGPPAEAATSRVIAVEPAENAAAGNADAASASADTAKLAAADATSVEATPQAKDSPALPAAVDLAALSRDIQTKLKDYGCYGGKIDASWGSGTRSAVDRFNKLANLDLNSDEPEQQTLDALKAWTGSRCPVEEIAREEPGPSTPPVVKKPRPVNKQVRKGPRYVPPRYIPPRVHRAPPDQGQGDFETDAVHQNLRPAR